MIHVDPNYPEVLVAARQEGTRPGAYVAPDRRERTAVRRIVKELVEEGERGFARAEAAAGEIGFVLTRVPELEGTVALCEEARRRQGGGAYLIREDSRSKLVVQAPHTFTDEGTLPLAWGLFQRSRARALFVDTVHRRKGAPRDARGRQPSDVAHNPRSTFHAATVGIVRAIPQLTVVQLHGFGARSSAARVVLSTGQAGGSRTYLDRVAASLTAVLGPGIVRYPEDTREPLGATRNVQGRRVIAAGGRFLHVELVREVREELLASHALRAAVFDALAAALCDLDE